MKNKLTPFTLHQIHVATDNFSATRLIGKGSHGSVYKGVLPDNTLVAVKKQSSPLHNSKLQNEVKILSSIIPPNPHVIVNLVGLADATILVTEYLPNGTLDDLLHSSSSPLHMLTWHKRLKFALQLAKALRHLHAPDVSVVHRDVKPTNVLLDINWNAKLADFGLATHLDDVSGASPAAAGTLAYMDPNYTSPNKLSTKVDVYSYGVVLLELISGRKAIDVAKSPASVVEWALPLIRQRRVMEVCDCRVWVPREMEGVIEVVLRTAERCVAEEEGGRPSMSEVVEVLERSAVEGVAAPRKYSVGEIVGNWMTMRRVRRRKIMCDDTWIFYFVNKYICGFDASL